MQSFCSIVMGGGDGSKARSPNPSETNTTTFCKPPSGAARTSSEVTPPGCNLAQLGSAFMFMRVEAGRGPTTFTNPLTTAVAAGVSCAWVTVGSRHAKRARAAKHLKTFVTFILDFSPVSLCSEERGDAQSSAGLYRPSGAKVTQVTGTCVRGM